MTRQRDAIGQLLDNANRIPLLTGQEEIILGRIVRSMMEIKNAKPEGPYTKEDQRIIKRGMRARDRMINANIKLVAMLAGNACRQRSGLMRNEHADLIQEGMFGLIRAIERFDPDRGYKFSTYAYWWIRQTISREIHHKGRLIKMPFHLSEKFQKINKVTMQLTGELGRSPTVAELAAALGITEAEMEYGLRIGGAVASLNMTLESGDELMVCVGSDEPGAYEDAERDERLLALRDALASLEPEERQVLEMRYGFNGQDEHIYPAIAKNYGMCGEWARRKVAGAQQKLKRRLAERAA